MQHCCGVAEAAVSLHTWVRRLFAKNIRKKLICGDVPGPVLSRSRSGKWNLFSSPSCPSYTVGLVPLFQYVPGQGSAGGRAGQAGGILAVNPNFLKNGTWDKARWKAASTASALPVVIELQAPAPLLVLCIVPPFLQRAHFSTGDDYQRTVIGLHRPDIFACDGVAL